MTWVRMDSAGGTSLQVPPDWGLVATTGHGAVFAPATAPAPAADPSGRDPDADTSGRTTPGSDPGQAPGQAVGDGSGDAGSDPVAAAGTLALVVREVAGHLTVDDWWAAVGADGAGLLLDRVEDAGGFRAEHVWVRDDRSMTTRTRVLHVPGRSLVVAAVGPTALAGDHQALVAGLLDGVEVPGARSRDDRDDASVGP